jgi:hypothetical protein
MHPDKQMLPCGFVHRKDGLAPTQHKNGLVAGQEWQPGFGPYRNVAAIHIQPDIEIIGGRRKTWACSPLPACLVSDTVEVCAVVTMPLTTFSLAMMPSFALAE